MPDFFYAKGRIGESLQFISQEMKEFEKEYSSIKWDEYRNDTKLQKLIDRTVENILTALIEVSGTILTEEGITIENYRDALKKIGNFFAFTEEEVERFGDLATYRNRLAHWYLNFRWQAVKSYAEQRTLIQRLLTYILERETEKSL